MNVLVTGGAGYIGSHTCVELLQAGHRIVVVDNFCNSKPKVLERIRTIAKQDFAFYELDVKSDKQLQPVFERHSLDAVIHFAGLKAVGESVRQPLYYYDENLNSTLSLCRMMQHYNVKRFVFSSSATVYGAPDVVPVPETAALRCSSPYGWSKYMNERILTDVAAANPDWSVVLLRYFNPIGAHESGLIGEDPNGIPNNLMPYITQVALGKREYLSVFGNDYPTKDGTGVRDYIHVVDLAKGHVAALQYADKHCGVEAVNLGTGVGFSVLDLVHTFEQVNHLMLPYRITPRRPGDVAEYYADPTKAKQLLHWQTERSLSDMCRDSWNWQQKNPNGYESD